MVIGTRRLKCLILLKAPSQKVIHKMVLNTRLETLLHGSFVLKYVLLHAESIDFKIIILSEKPLRTQHESAVGNCVMVVVVVVVVVVFFFTLLI